MMLYALDELLSLYRCGGKAANLARAARAGIDVPDTLVLECDAQRVFLEESGLLGEVQAYLRDTRDLSPQRLEERFSNLSRAVAQAPLPGAFRAEWGARFGAFLDRVGAPVAVRSSALVEDSAERSYAGVFESELHLRSVADIERSIRRVWCSLWSPRALRYAWRFDATPAPADMAVMVQRQLPARCSGVIYTAEPLSGNPFRLQLHAVAGLSSDLMSGSGRGESCTIDWDTREVDLGAMADLLSKEEAGRLTELALQLDDLFGLRLDIEWAIAEGRVWIVQARPLTALPDYFPHEFTPEQAQQKWELPNFIIPLRKDCASNLVTPLYDHFDAMELWYRYHPEDSHFAGINWKGADWNGHRYAVLEPDRTFIHTFQDDWSRLDPWLEHNEPRYRTRWDNHEQEIRGIADRARDAIANTRTAQELIPVWIRTLDDVMDLISFGWSAPQAMGWMHEALISYLMNRVEVKYDLAPLMAGSDTSISFRFARDLQALARSVEVDAVLSLVTGLPPDKLVSALQGNEPGRALLDELDALFWEYGKIPLSWEGRPGFWVTGMIWGGQLPLMQTFKSAVEGSERDVVELQRQALARRIEYQEELKQQVQSRDPALGERFDAVMARARVWTQALNDRHLIGAAWNWEKELAWEIGSRLTRAGLLKRPVDLLAIPVNELAAVSELRDVSAWRLEAESRVAEYDRNRRFTPPAQLGSRADVAASVEDELDWGPAAHVFQGRGLTGRRTEGVARRVRDLFDPRLLESLTDEQILVLPEEHAFFYADWHSIFTIVRGVVSPGRPSHHLTQVARECGMPVIGYVTGDLTRIHDGMRIELDPAAGTVTLIDGPAPG